MNIWDNPIHQRLLAWLVRWSPSMMRAPTLREALTGKIFLGPDEWERNAMKSPLFIAWREEEVRKKRTP